MRNSNSLVAALALMSVSTFSAAEGLYLFATAGQADLENPDLTGTVTTITDDTGTTFSLGLGYQFNDYFSLEGGYTDLGEIDINVAGPATLEANGATVNGPATVDISGFFFGVKGEAMVTENVSIFARAGAFAWESDFEGSGTSAELNNSTDAYGSLGAAYHLTDNTAVDLQVSHYRLDGDAVNTYTLGLTYKF